MYFESTLTFFCQNHSQCNRTVCGGDDFYARDDCVAMGEDGEWTEVGTMMEFRTDHACWDIEGELYRVSQKKRSIAFRGQYLGLRSIY